MRVRLKGLNSKRKRLADGTLKTYYYAWKGGPPLRGEPGSPEFVACYNEAVAKGRAADRRVAGAAVSLSRKRRISIWNLAAHPPRLHQTDKAHRARLRRFSDQGARRSAGAICVSRLARSDGETSLRQADYAYGTLARILSWAHNRGLIAKNPCAKVGKLYHGTRVNKIWNDEDVTRFLQTAPPYLRLAMLLAINTGQRQGDLLRLPWSAYDGTEIKLRQRKTGAYVPIPVADALKAALDAAPRQSPIMLTNSEGKPWSESGFQGAWGKATMRAGIRGLTFHDLRGTAVVTLARAGCNEVEIYSITGHKPGDVRAILTAHYLPRDAEVASNAIAKLNRYKKARGDHKGDESLPTVLPTALKIAKLKTEKS